VSKWLKNIHESAEKWHGITHSRPCLCERWHSICCACVSGQQWCVNHIVATAWQLTEMYVRLCHIVATAWQLTEMYVRWC